MLYLSGAFGSFCWAGNVNSPYFLFNYTTMKRHCISPGDSLASIAACYNTDYQTIQSLNGLTGFSIYIGDYLIVPSDETDAAFEEDNNKQNTSKNISERGNIELFATPAAGTYIVKAGDTLSRIATSFNTTPEILRQLNNLGNNSNIFIGQILRLPTATNSNSTSQDTPIPPAPERYTVKPGDTLTMLAWIFNISAETIKALNNLKTETLTPGQVLVLHADSPQNTNNTTNTPPATPPAGTVNLYYTVAAGDTFYKIAQKFGIKVADILAWNQLPAAATLNVGQQLIVGKKTGTLPPEKEEEKPPPQKESPPAGTTNLYYTVVAGDTFYRIAQKFGIKVADILAWNQLPATAALSIGQQLIVGKKTGTNHSTPTPDIDNNNSNNSNNTPNEMPQSGTFTVDNPPLTPVIKFAISDTVGINGRNIGQDVKVIQAQLMRAGFLSTSDENNEAPPANQIKIGAEAIPKTIAAIRVFQTVIVGAASPNSVVRPEDTTHQFLSTFVLPPTAEQLDAIKEALKIINIKINSGREELSAPLSAPVGLSEVGNNAEDVKKVQIALVQLNLLSLTHGETPATSTSVSPAKLPKTIEAIKRFQRLRVEYWRGMPAIAGNSSYTAGVIGRDDKDLSFKILRDYIEYLVSFPNPNNAAAIVNVSFRNFIPSKYTQYTEGVSYQGEVVTGLPLKEYEQLGLNKLQAQALRFVSTHEGNFDAINSYDKATFSYGFIQFAGSNSTGGLAPMLALMKINRPAAFKQYFQQYGIDVEYAVLKGEINKASLLAIHPVSGKLLRRGEAEACIKSFKTLTAVFIRAAYHIDMQRAQIEAAKRMFVMPAFNIEAGFRIRVIRTLGPDRQTPVATYVGTKADQYRLKDEYTILKNAHRIDEETIDFNGRPLTDIIRSEKGLTALLDLSVNKWIIETQAQFVNAITQVAADKALDTKEKICAIDEKSVLTEIAKAFGNSQIKDRIENILASTDLSILK